MQLTYLEALDSIIEHTKMGYTLASQDRLWIVFIYDLTSDGGYASMRYNRLYPLVGERSGWTYDRDMSGVPVWTKRHEAEAFAKELRQTVADYPQSPEVYVINLVDDARLERWVLGDAPLRIKYKGSEPAVSASIEMSRKWRGWMQSQPKD